jgi:hypothetical protein
LLTRRKAGSGIGFPRSVLSALAARWARADADLALASRNRLEQLKIEVRHKLLIPVNSMKIEIKNSTVNQLNLGSVLGDMNNAITTLAQQGHQDLASALKRFTELIASSIDLGPAQRDVVENLAFISEQAVLPAVDRKQSLLNAAISHIQSVVQTVGTLNEVWKTISPMVESLFN